MRAIVDRYPLASIRDIQVDGKEIWDVATIPLGKLVPDLGRAALSLNDIEHEILRKRHKDARVHAAVNCASVGCPPLAAEAFVAERLDEQLDARVRAWLAGTSRNRFHPKEGRVEISQIFDWFRSDFEHDAGRRAPVDRALRTRGRRALAEGREGRPGQLRRLRLEAQLDAVNP